MLHDDMVFILHIRDSCIEAMEILGNSSPKEMIANKMQRYALLKVLEVIGEASIRVSKELKDEHPEIPWKKMAGLKNRLVHGYMDIDYSIVHETVRRDIPKLLPDIESLIR